MRKHFLCELATASLSSSPALPHHSAGAGDGRLSCPHTDSCSDDFPVLCTSMNAPCWLAGIVLCGSLRAYVFICPFTEPVLCMNTRFFFSAHTELTGSGLCGDVRWIWQKVHSIRIADFTFEGRLHLHFLPGCSNGNTYSAVGKKQWRGLQLGHAACLSSACASQNLLLFISAPLLID